MNVEAAARINNASLAVRKPRSTVVIGEESILGPKARFELVFDPDDESAARFSAIQVEMAGSEARNIFLAAADSASRRASLFATSPEASVQAGFAQLAANQVVQAKASFEHAISMDPKHRSARLGLARILHKLDDSDPALRLLDQLLSEFPKDAELIVAKAVILVELLRVPEARNLLNNFEGDQKNAAHLYAARGSLKVVEGDYKSGISDLRKALRYHPEWVSARNALGIAELKMGRVLNAEQRFKEAMRIGPLHEESFENLLRSYLATKQFALIRTLARKRTAIADASPTIARIASRAALEQSLWAEARAWLTSAVAKTEDPVILASLENDVGVTHSRQSNYKKALEYFEKAYQRQPLALFGLNKGKTFLSIGEPQRAIDWISSLTGLSDREQFDAKKVLVTALLRAHRIYDGINLAKSLIAAPGSDADVFIVLSGVYTDECDDTDEAIRIASAGLARWPDDLGLHNNLAYALLMSGQVDHARAVLRRVDRKVPLYEQSIPLVATQGLLALWEGDLVRGEELYDLAVSRAAQEGLRGRVAAKRDLELAKALLRLGANNSRIIYLLTNVASQGAPVEPYSTQAARELRKLKNPGK